MNATPLKLNGQEFVPIFLIDYARCKDGKKDKCAAYSTRPL
jgi:hypothetical protein